MKNKKIVIAGGTGFIGQAITKYFGKDNDLVILSRELKNEKTNSFGQNIIDKEFYPRLRYVKWNAHDVEEWSHEINGADIILNLAGKTVNCRYTKKNKNAIFASRIDSTKAIARAIQLATVPPKLWINASSATIYRDARDRPQDELNGEFHDDFSVQVCKLWEKTLDEERTPFTRKVALRMAITLGDGGVMTPYFNLLKYYLGGKQGSGKQMYSWVHIHDTCRMIEWIHEHDDLEGVYNCCSPNPVTNAELMEALRTATGHRFGLPAPAWLLKIGAKIIGTETELIFKSRWVLPTKILNTGFEFRYPKLHNALAEILAHTKRKRYQLF